MSGSRRRTVTRVLGWVLVANLAVIAVKLWIGVRSGSIAILGDAAHSGVDALNNIVALAAMRMAATPPDEDHPYGHGKFETMGAVAIVSFLAITCFELLTGAIARLVTGAPPPTIEPVMLWILGATMVVNIAVARSEAYYGRKLKSELLQADARHTAADVKVTAAVIAGLLLIRLGLGQADAWLAILVALVIGWSGLQILRTTVPVLVDQVAINPDRIREVAESTAGVARVSAIRSRGRPREAFIELTIHVEPELTVVAAHEVADEVERRLKDSRKVMDVVVHVEPHAPGRAADQGETGSSFQRQ